MSAPRRAAQAASAAGLAGALVLAAPLAASAHVHVDPSRAEPGAAATLTFSVPNESDTATTLGVRIGLPAGLGRVRAAALPGWRQQVVLTDGRPSAVEFTATGDGVGVGATQAFTVRIGAVPDTGRVVLPVEQRYSDGRTVQWDDPTPASGAEPEHPAPTLYVRDAPPAEQDDEAEEHEEAASATTSAALPLGLSAAALVVALGALVVAVVGLLRRR